MATLSQSLGDTLHFIEAGAARNNHKTFTDALAFSQQISTNFKVLTVSHTFNPQGTVKGTWPHHSVSFSDILALTDKLSRTHFEQFYDLLTFSQKADQERKGVISYSDVVKFVDQGVIGVGRTTTKVSQSLSFRDSFSSTLVNTSIPSPPPYNTPSPGSTGSTSSATCTTIQLTVAFKIASLILGKDTTTTLILPLPAFGNIHDLDYSRISPKNVYNQILVYRPDYWPTTNTYHLTFTTLPDDKKNEIESFYYFTLGHVVQYVDPYGVTFDGVITSPQLEFVEKNDCTWEVKIEFSVFGNGIHG